MPPPPSFECTNILSDHFMYFHTFNFFSILVRYVHEGFWSYVALARFHIAHCNLHKLIDQHCDSRQHHVEKLLYQLPFQIPWRKRVWNISQMGRIRDSAHNCKLLFSAPFSESSSTFHESSSSVDIFEWPDLAWSFLSDIIQARK